MAEQRQCVGCGKAYWWPAAKWQHEKCVANRPVANVSVANKEEAVVANNNPESWRVQVWRQGNRDRYNSRQRDLMREKRAKAREKAH